MGKICTHASDELRDLPIGDQIVTLALICSNDRENNTAVATIHNFLASHGKIPRNPEIFKIILSLQILYVKGLETFLKQEIYMIIILEEDIKPTLC